MKMAIPRELQRSSNVYLDRFNTWVKAADETYVAFASKVRTLLDCYLTSGDVVTQFEDLCDLLICDQIKSSLTKGCLKYILSIESNKTGQN